MSRGRKDSLVRRGGVQLGGKLFSYLTIGRKKYWGAHSRKGRGIGQSLVFSRTITANGGLLPAKAV